MTKLRNYEFSKYYVIFFFKQLSLPCFGCLSFVLWKKIRNRLREYWKIRNFVTYQITFLMTCQQHNIQKLLVLHLNDVNFYLFLIFQPMTSHQWNSDCRAVMFTVGRAPQFLADQLTLSQPGGPWYGCVCNFTVGTTFWINSKGPVQLCPSPGSAADSCPPWPYNAPGSIAYRWHSYIIDSYSIWMLATCPYGGGWLWQTWNGATALCMQGNGGKNNVLLKLYHVLLLLFWLFCGTELFCTWENRKVLSCKRNTEKFLFELHEKWE